MAKSFQFSLQKVLDVRKAQEKQQVVDLNRAERAHEEEAQRLAELEAERQMLMEHQHKAGEAAEELDLRQMQIHSGYLMQLDMEITLQSERVIKAADAVAVEREKLKLAARDRKSVEVLRDRAYAAYRKTRTVDEQKQENEVASQMTHRRDQKNEEQSS